VRPRRGRYLWTHTHDSVKLAVGEGGRLDCVSLLALLGVFVQGSHAPHVQVHPHSTRLPPTAVGTVRHWRTSHAADDAVITPVVEALVQAVRCQTPRAAIATLDSAWHLRLVDEAGIAAIFAALPRRYRRLRGLLDRRAESGTETLVRLMLRTLGARPELQVKITGVGFVDLLVDGWLIVECDSEAHHADWKQIKADRRRDAAAAAQGYMTLRLLAEDILYRPDWVLGVLRNTLTHGSPAARVQNSGRTAPTAVEKRLPRRPPTEPPEL
jgi:very-short-patch-repair endonuclease